MNSYEEKQEARQERYRVRAEKARTESEAACNRAFAVVANIPLGQPILVDHYSANRHRAAIKRSDNAMRKAVELTDKAKHYDRKADGVGSAGISSDDPDAIHKLTAELNGAKAKQERMKSVNVALRKNKTVETRSVALAALGLSPEDITETLKPDYMGRVGFPSYALQNNSANMRRIELRIEQLQALTSREAVSEIGDGYEYREDADENRVLFIFEGKPDEATRSILKRNAFKWSPSRGAWVRQLTGNALRAARSVKAALAELKL